MRTALVADRFVVCVQSVVTGFYPFLQLEVVFKAAFVKLIILIGMIYYMLPSINIKIN
jgi:hypothetical protein